jgi:hypothetical protein
MPRSSFTPHSAVGAPSPTVTGTASKSKLSMFNTDTNRAEDVSHAMAQEILRRLDFEGRNVPSELKDFIDLRVGRDCAA